MDVTGESIFVEVKSEEEARSFILELVLQVEAARDQSDVVHESWRLNLPDPTTGARIERSAVRRAFTNWAFRYGRAMGSLTTLMHCRKLNDVAYNELRRRVVNTGVPKVSQGIVV